jgi:hypothetical protein
MKQGFHQIKVILQQSPQINWNSANNLFWVTMLYYLFFLFFPTLSSKKQIAQREKDDR